VALPYAGALVLLLLLLLLLLRMLVLKNKLVIDH
jgi:hypothetical protein